MDNRHLARAYLGELLDRVLRFDMHLSLVEKEFYHGPIARSDAGQDRPLFLDSFRACVDDVLSVVYELGLRCDADLANDELTAVMRIARHGFTAVTELHETGLLHLPRPSEPTELRRFLRMISRHVLMRPKPDLAVYITEATTETAFAENPLTRIRRRAIASLLNMASSFSSIENPESSLARADHDFSEGADAELGIHVTIARVDARNPLRWPSLMHEAAHKLLGLDIVGPKSLHDQFEEWLPEILRQDIRQLPMAGQISVKSWLIEVWCDLFAALVLGPTFFFRQFAAFVTNPADVTMNPDYPPHALRLRLIRGCLRHRYPDVSQDETIRTQMDECFAIVEYWDKMQGNHLGANKDFKLLFDAMREFFQDHFFSGPGTADENFRKKYENMVRYVREIDLDQLRQMQHAVSEGLPAPSKPHRSGVWLAEEPTSIQEVLLAAWLDRLTNTRMASLSDFTAGGAPNGEGSRAKLLRRLERFDDAVLRSLQLAEWLHVLVPEAPKSLDSDLSGRRAAPNEQRRQLGQDALPLLNDREISQLLEDGALKIVPLVDLDQQLGSTSLDIRLGTSFEVYLPAYMRTPGLEDNAIPAYDSRSIDVDFLEHVVLLPGQIVLAHSFEYVRLPANIAGELEGRSSYARLGLEVHLTAGMIDPGFEGVITLELVNNGPNPIPLFPGVRIAQLRLVAVHHPARPYSSRHSAKYRGLLHHRTSLFDTDPDYLRMKAAIDEISRSRVDRTSKTPDSDPAN